MNRSLATILVLSAILFVSSIADDACIKDPTQEACKDYQYPEDRAKVNLESLCKSMPNMPFCSIKSVCSNNIQYSADKYCNAVSLYKGICSPQYDAMINMANCADWKTMCGNGTLVPSCNIQVLQGVPKSKDARQLVTQICNEMTMSGCEKCSDKKPCDLLSVYSTLCLEMPDMKECADWNKMCVHISTWPFCSIASNGDAVQMRMYFHTGIEDYVLFRDWVPRTWIQYFATCFAVVAFGVLYEGLKYMRTVVEKSFSNGVSYQSLNDANPGALQHPPFRWRQDLLRALLHFLEVMWGLMVMLIAMTYNVGLVVCVGIGAFFGNLIFGRLMKYEPKSSSCH